MNSAPAESLPWVAAVSREPADFERHLRENQRLVYQIAYGVLRNSADAEEVAQEVFLRAYRKLASLREPEKFRAWVGRMSWRLALNRQRASARALRRDTAWFARPAPPPSSAETLVAGRELESRLQDEINRLPEKLRAVLLLSALDGLETRAVAMILEIPEGTVRSRLHLARKYLLRRVAL